MKAANYKFKNKRAKKAFVLPKCFFIAGLVCLALMLLFGLITVLKTRKAVKNEMSYREFIIQSSQGEKAVVSLDIDAGSELTEIMSEGKYKYVFAEVGGEAFVLRLGEKELKKLTDEIKDAKESVSVTGYTLYLFDELKEKMAPIVGEKKGLDDVSASTVTRYTGAYYTCCQKDNLFLMLFTVGRSLTKAAIIFLILGVLLLITAKRLKKKAVSFAANSEVSFPVLDNELNDVTTFWFDTLKIYATKNYLVGMGSRINVVKYSNLQWIYNYQQIFMETPFFQKVKILDIKGRLTAFTTPSFGTSKNGRIAIEMKQLSETVLKHNPDVKFGNSPEVSELMSEKIIK